MSDSRTKNSAKNVAAGFACQGAALLLSFVSRSVFVMVLSSEYLGINGLFSNILTVLSFAELGIGEALSYAMYQPAKEGNREKLCQLMRLYKTAYRGIALFVTVVGVVASFFLDYLVAEKPNIPENFQLIFWLFLFNNVCSYLLAYKQSILLVEQKKYIVLYIQQGTKVGQLLLQMAVLFFAHSYYGFLLVQVVCTLLTNVFISLYVKKAYPWLNDRSVQAPLSSAEQQKIFKDVKALAISKVAGIVSNGSDNIVIAKILGLTSVGVVSNYTLVINSFSSILWGTLSGVTGSMGNFNVNASVEKRRAIFEELYLIVYWIFCLCCTCLIVLLNPFVEIWVGSSYQTDLPIVVALVLIAYVSGMNFPVYTFRVTCGLFDEMKYPYFWSGVANVALSVVLALKMGLFGVYIATVITRLLISETVEGYIVYHKILEKPFWRYVVRYLLSVLLLGGCALLCGKAVQIVPGTGIVALLGKGVVTFCLCNAILWLLFARTPTFARVCRRIKTLVSRNKAR